MEIIKCIQEAVWLKKNPQQNFIHWRVYMKNDSSYLGCLLLAWDLHLSIVIIPSETPLEKPHCSFASGWLVGDSFLVTDGGSCLLCLSVLSGRVWTCAGLHILPQFLLLCLCFSVVSQRPCFLPALHPLLLFHLAHGAPRRGD